MADKCPVPGTVATHKGYGTIITAEKSNETPKVTTTKGSDLRTGK